MNQRKQNIGKLKTRKVPIASDGKPFIEALDERIKALKNIFGEDIEIANIDKLIDQLESIKELRGVMLEFTEAVRAIKAPDEVKLTDIDKVIENISKINFTPQIKVVTSDIYDEYKAANTYQADDVNIYHGFLNRNGKWFILWQSGASTSIAYKYATSQNNKIDYQKAILDPIKLNYQRYDEIVL